MSPIHTIDRDPPPQTAEAYVQHVEEFGALLVEQAKIGLRRRSDDTLTPADMRAAFNHLLAPQNRCKTRDIACEIALPIGGFLMGLVFQFGVIALAGGAAVLVLASIAKHSE